MVIKLSENEIKQIQEKVQKEFPSDPALQQFHSVRKGVTGEAEKSGESYLTHVRRQGTIERRKKK